MPEPHPSATVRGRGLRALLEGGRVDRTIQTPDRADAVVWQATLTAEMIRNGSLPLPDAIACMVPRGRYDMVDGTYALRITPSREDLGDQVARGAARLLQRGGRAGSRFELLLWPGTRQAQLQLLEARLSVVPQCSEPPPAGD